MVGRWPAVRRRLGRIKRRLLRQPMPQEDVPRFGFDDIDALTELFFTVGPHVGGPWDAHRDAHLVLPPWFRHGLDPWSEEYKAQQLRLWSAIARVDDDYDPEVHEREFGWEGVDPVRTPGFYMRRDGDAVAAAGDHLLASGMLHKHAGLKPGDWALEYGAGFGHTALSLARLGVNVDTVDVSPTFCDFVRVQAEHFGVPLTPFAGRFGMKPRPDRRYKLVWFYESFHHCLDFAEVVPRLLDVLEPGGTVILSGEPIVEQPNHAVPYPWGVRLHSEVVAVVRKTRWCELGFTEAFLMEVFARSGFVGHRVDCPPSLFGQLFIFRRGSDAAQAPEPGA